METWEFAILWRWRKIMQVGTREIMAWLWCVLCLAPTGVCKSRETISTFLVKPAKMLLCALAEQISITVLQSPPIVRDKPWYFIIHSFVFSSGSHATTAFCSLSHHMISNVCENYRNFRTIRRT